MAIACTPCECGGHPECPACRRADIAAARPQVRAAYARGYKLGLTDRDPLLTVADLRDVARELAVMAASADPFFDVAHYRVPRAFNLGRARGQLDVSRSV